jgi:uncharacterized protein (DUF58 family)
MSRGSKLLLILILLVLSLAVSGCIKVHITIDVDPNGSGKLGMALAMTAQAKALAGSEGIGDPAQAISEGLAQGATAQDIEVERWTEGEYEWIKVTAPFKDPGDLTSKMKEFDLFQSFNLARQSDFFTDYYVLDAVIAPSDLESDMPQDLDFDISGFLEMRLGLFPKSF